MNGLILSFLLLSLQFGLCQSSPNFHTAFHSPSIHPLFSLAINKITKDIRRILVENIDPSSIDARNLVGALPLNAQHKAATRVTLNTQSLHDVYFIEKSVLTTNQVHLIRTWAEDKINGKSVDTVDGCPEWQVAMDRNTLNTILGTETTNRVYDLPQRYLAASASLESYNYPNPETVDVGCFIRKYEISGRPFIGFHVDDCDATVNVCLSTPQECNGGKLLLIGQGKVISPPRTLGDALIHPWHTCHAVTAVTSGVRWSLILFFSNTYPPDHRGFYNLHAPSSKKRDMKLKSEPY